MESTGFLIGLLVVVGAEILSAPASVRRVAAWGWRIQHRHLRRRFILLLFRRR